MLSVELVAAEPMLWNQVAPTKVVDTVEIYDGRRKYTSAKVKSHKSYRVPCPSSFKVLVLVEPTGSSSFVLLVQPDVSKIPTRYVNLYKG